MDTNYIVTIKVQEEGGGYLERKYRLDQTEEEGLSFYEQIQDMKETLQKSKEVKF